jgi:ATP synthase protein I
LIIWSFPEMSADYARIARRSGAVAAAVAAVMVALSAALAGGKGLLAALIAVAIVALFFGISVLAVGRAARVSPQAMMATAVATYLVKILILLFLVGQFQNTTAFNPRLFGLTAIVLVLVYSAAQVIWSMRLKMLYVEPDGKR